MAIVSGGLGLVESVSVRGVVVSSVSSNEMSLADLERTIMTVESVAVPPWVH